MSGPFGNIPIKKVDYYWALQVQQHASTEEITEAYLRLKPYYQNLVNGGDTHYTELLNLTENGYQTLIDPEMRARYDLELNESNRKHQRETLEVFQKSLDEIDREMRKLNNDIERSDAITSSGESESSTARSPGKLIVGWQIAVLLVSNLLTFWINYNASPPGIFLGVAVAIGVFSLIYLGAAFKENNNPAKIKALVLAISLMCTNFITYNLYQNQELYVDNQNPYDIYVKVDNEYFTEVKSFKYEITEIRPGRHTIKTFKKLGDSLLEEFDAEVIHREKKLYNVLSTAAYITGKKAYSERAVLDFINGKKGRQFEEYEIKERWIWLNYSYIFENPPSSITVKKKISDFSKREAVRSYIIRKNQRSF